MTIEIPIIDFSLFLAGEDSHGCKDMTRAAENLGLFLVRDPRIPRDVPNRYREMMQRFFRLPEEVKAKYIQPLDEDSVQFYEKGWRPPFTERPRPRREVLPHIPKSEKPHHPPKADPKERFMAPCGPRRETTEYPMLDYRTGYIPEEIEDWVQIHTEWERAVHGAMLTVCEMLAIGFGEETGLFRDLFEYGPNRLAPTGLDLRKHGTPGTVAAGFHNDFSGLTLHGRSNCPGLWAWTSNWRKFPVTLPDDGCLLVQCGRVMEHLTSGTTLRGYHEVVITEEPPANIDWRVSTTAFFNIETSAWVEPVGRFRFADKAKVYFAEREKSGDRILRKAKGKATVATK